MTDERKQIYVSVEHIVELPNSVNTCEEVEAFLMGYMNNNILNNPTGEYEWYDEKEPDIEDLRC